MRALFSFGLLLIVALIVGTLIKLQVQPASVVPAATQTAPATAVKPLEAPKRVQQEVNNAAHEAAKRLQQTEGKQ